MAAKYNVVARGNPRDQSAPKKYYPSVIASGKITLRQLAEQIASISTVSTIDTLAALEAFLQVIPQHLADGKIVDLGEFGSFWIKIKSTGSETAEEVNATNITNVLPRFRPGKDFKKILTSMDFNKS